MATIALLVALVATGGVWWWLERTRFEPLRARLVAAETKAATFEARQRHLEHVLSGMPDGVLLVDSEVQTLFANAALARNLGLDSGADVEAVPQLAPGGEIHDLLSRAVATGSPQTGALEVATTPSRTLSLNATPLEGGELGAVLVASDITDLVRLSEMRRDFVANFSHELKTPLSAIRGYAETLRDGALQDLESAPGFLNRILEQSDRLERLLEDLLTLSRLESVEADADWHLVDLREVAEDARNLISRRASSRDVQVELELHAAPAIVGDADAVERMLLNLLENAVKYNREGGHVRLRVRSEGRHAVISVSDDGIGIPRRSLPRIFERFYRVDRGRSRAEGGTGLGLAIVKHAAQLHGGNVEVESEVGKGSTFTVRLPLAPSHAQP